MKKFWKWVKGLFGNKPTGNPEGTSEIKDVIKNVISVIAKVKNARSDEKITGIEWIGIGKTALPIVQNVKRWELFKSQVLDFTTEEGSEMAGWLAMQGVIGDDAKVLVKHAISAIEKSIVIYKDDISEIIRILQG
jgi:hypothetical protein